MCYGARMAYQQKQSVSLRSPVLKRPGWPSIAESYCPAHVMSGLRKRSMVQALTFCLSPPRIAGLAVELVEHHRAPQDRLIIAMALSYDATLISADTRLPLYTELNGRLLT